MKLDRRCRLCHRPLRKWWPRLFCYRCFNDLMESLRGTRDWDAHERRDEDDRYFDVREEAA